jgi:polyphenol oxidase
VTGNPVIEVETPVNVRAVFTLAGPSRDFGAANLQAGAMLARQAVALGLHPRRVALNRQVHGAEVVRVTTPPSVRRYAGRADGLSTSEPALALVVLGADCLPILMWRNDATAVAAAHAGWRGIIEGVIEATAAALDDPGGVGVAIGPGIGPCCYPVSDDVRATFDAKFGSETVVGQAVDLGLAARVALERHGIASDRIADRLACTACDPAGRFYSYRRDGAAAGRHAGLIWLRGDGILGG